MSKILLVVGMHRSATSLVARGLHLAGVHMGDDLLPAAPSNPWGHYEDKPVVELNDRILTAAGGSWDQPPSHVDIIEASGRYVSLPKAIGRYVQTRQGHDLWGMKDPRLSLTWPLWLPHLGEDLHVLWIRRSTDEVARSLYERDGMPLESGRKLARQYEDRIATLVEYVRFHHQVRSETDYIG